LIEQLQLPKRDPRARIYAEAIEELMEALLAVRSV
jgi:hypothetical protein